MIFEILSTSSMLAIAGSTYFFQNKSSSDHDKIKIIADQCGLKTKDESIRIYRKSHKKNYSEYIYKIPLGLTLKEFQAHEQNFIDGLNNKSRPDLNLVNLKNINWKGDVIKQIKSLINNRVKLDKQIEIEFDGMLRFKVYDHGLKTEYLYNDEMLKKLNEWKVLIGYTYQELLIHDFEKRPHMIVAGATGFGKSEFIKLMISVLIQQKPDHVRLHLIDLKGGSELGPFRTMKQAVNFARDPKEAKRILEDIQTDMNTKLDWNFENGVKDVKAASQKERDFIFIDEALNE